MVSSLLVFFATFVLTASFVFYVSHVVVASLQSAGFYFTDIILVGLPKDPNNPEMGNFEFEEYIQPLKELLQPYQEYIQPVQDYVETLTLTSPEVLAAAGTVFATVLYISLFGAKPARKILDKSKDWQEFPLSEKFQISPNTAIYRFAFPNKTDVLGLPIGQHVSIAAEINGKEVMRSYTPVSSDDDKGHFDLLIKTYEQGNISRHVSLLKIGQNIRVKGPKGQFSYSPDLCDHIGMIAGGTGLTPMLQIIRAALKDPKDTTKISLIYANVNPDDILLKEDLEKLLETSNNRLKVYYVLNNPPASWKGGVGFVTKDHIADRLPPASANSKILMCGPPPMINAMKKHLDELKYPAPRTVSKLMDQVFVF